MVMATTTFSTSTAAAAAAVALANHPTPSAPSSTSPKRVAHDLIDATCQEILLLSGENQDSIATHASYAVLVRRWDTYMKLLELGGGDLDQVEEFKNDDKIPSASKGSMPENSVRNGKVVRCRSIIARLVINVCMRLTYPKAVTDASAIQNPRSDLPALIDMKASDWREVREDLGLVRGVVQKEGGRIEPAFESIICQIEAMEILAKLRKRLPEAVTEIDEAEDGRNPAFDHECVMRDLDKYQLSSRTISGKLRCIHHSNSSHPICFTKHVAWPRLRTTAKVSKDAVTSLMERIDGSITEELFPLRSFQVQLLELLRHWDKTYLPSPVLFKNGYFKHHSEMTSPILADGASPVDGLLASSTAKTASLVGKENDRGGSGKSEIEILATFQVGGRTVEVKSSPSRACGQKRERNSSPPKKRAVQPRRKLFEFESDNIISARGSPANYSPRKKRIPYSAEEKKALLDGVNKFGVGHWKLIREHYDDVFGEHNRTNVNLKDLYRNLTKDE